MNSITNPEMDEIAKNMDRDAYSAERIRRSIAVLEEYFTPIPYLKLSETYMH